MLLRVPKRFLMLALISAELAGSACNAGAQEKEEKAAKSAAENDVQAVVTAYRAALQARSTDAMAKVVADEFLVVEGGKSNVGWPNYRDTHIGPEMEEWKSFKVKSVKNLATNLSDGVGYVVDEAAYTVETASGKRDMGSVETFVLKKMDGGYKIVHLHYTGRSL